MREAVMYIQVLRNIVTSGQAGVRSLSYLYLLHVVLVSLVMFVLLQLIIFLLLLMFVSLAYYQNINTVQGLGEKEAYPTWAMFVALGLVLGGILPIPVVYFMRRFQCIRLDSDIHQASIKRVETTMSTQGMIRNEEVRYIAKDTFYL